MSVAYQDSDLETVIVTCWCKNTCLWTNVVPAKLLGFSAVVLGNAATGVPLLRIWYTYVLV